jgi:hypothetical protein
VVGGWVVVVVEESALGRMLADATATNARRTVAAFIVILELEIECQLKIREKGRIDEIVATVMGSNE